MKFLFECLLVVFLTVNSTCLADKKIEISETLNKLNGKNEVKIKEKELWQNKKYSKANTLNFIKLSNNYNANLTNIFVLKCGCRTPAKVDERFKLIIEKVCIKDKKNSIKLVKIGKYKILTKVNLGKLT